MSPVRFGRLTLTAVLALVLSTPGVGADEPVFEVVSIREVPRDAPPLMRDPNVSSILPGGRYTDPRVTLHSMIVFAFGIPSYLQLKGLPRWAEEQPFSVAARPAEGFPLLPPEKNREQVRAMMREMLASRFHLKVHTETASERIFRLEVDRGGLKLKAADPPAPPEKEGHVNIAFVDSGGRMIGTKATMAGMASSLTTMLKRQVLDATGLSDYYTFNVKWSAPELVDAGGILPAASGEDGTGALISAVKDLFGLGLTSAIGAVRYWVVDDVEHPTAN